MLTIAPELQAGGPPTDFVPLLVRLPLLPRLLLQRFPGLLFPRRLHCLELCLALFAVAFPLRTIPFILSFPSFRFFWCGAHCFCYSAAAVATSRKKKLQ